MNGRSRTTTSTAAASGITRVSVAPAPLRERAARGRDDGAAGRARKSGRSLVGYLLVPRPKDMVKALLMPATFVLGVLAGGHLDGDTLVRAAVAWVALELLVYPARYQWNDVRGFVADQAHPDERGRGRLPGPVARARAHVTASCTVALARLAAVAALALLLPGLGGLLGAITVGVFGIAVAYEALRAGTGRTGRVPPPLRPRLIALWVVVGAGYALRGMVGLVAAVGLGERPVTLVAAAVALWAFGIAFVTSRWALEALAFARIDDGRLVWTARAEQAREHLLGLVRWLPDRTTERDPAAWAALRSRTPVTAPWNLALVLAGTAAGLTGMLLTGAQPAPAAAAALLGGVAAAVAVFVPRGRVAVVLAGAVAQWGALVAEGAPRPLAAVLPWFAVMAAYLVFSGQRLNTIGTSDERVRAAVVAVFAPVVHAVVGDATWGALRTGGLRGSR
ncbi:hypothetical protein [Amycolatopsis rifamycinica]|uniref:UbiA prenyltransferase n=1 Tax=Amycolatopsis rifamycinica TaxID=287986 RepID=A0A066TMT9_9PSEU|nr:hypothetical protein [Amycolatopsis rifamycinica]KDN16451.1 hypothetical protein DV20_41340 [Amycolatopsis rifamycinica]